ncbi:MAG: hypothetical protein MUF54_25995 [Polyangiaceae bacterium]|nr:hypothetical protein [Polyangiaceae bacterium]
MAIAHVRRLLLELGFEEAPERLIPVALGYSLWVCLPIAELADKSPRELVEDAEGCATLRKWIVGRLELDR